jgi:hypothetical protein
MSFRLKAFAIHLLTSAAVLSLVLGGLWLGWYRWPGWFLASVLEIAGLLVMVDVVLGPLMTLVIASPKKPRRELARDLAIIAIVQLAALGYGSATLWRGRPLYYAFSVDRVDLVQASQLREADIALGAQHNPSLAPHWYSTPRWVWSPLPQDQKELAAILFSAAGGGADIQQMPRYYRSWESGQKALLAQLRPVDAKYFTPAEASILKERLGKLGVAADAAVTLPMQGRGRPLLAVFDRDGPRLRAILSAR